MPEFDLLIPKTLAEALEMLARYGSEAAPIAGGTNVVVGMREGRLRQKILVDVSRLAELRGIRQTDGHIRVGGGVTIAELLDEPLIARFGGPLREAAQGFANPLVRNRATVAGNLVDASPAADTAPPLLVLGAEVELEGQGGKRRVPLDRFLIGPNETARRPDELLMAVRWPVPLPDSAAAYRKLALRKGTACSVISAAVMVEWDGSGQCRQARIALGAVAARPLRAYAAEEMLRGRGLSEAAIVEAGRLAAGAVDPIDDVRGSAAYRRRMVEVLVRRLLSQTAGHADSQE
jgi:carbon-monoxide dehydrogenase medium subunit